MSKLPLSQLVCCLYADKKPIAMLSADEETCIQGEGRDGTDSCLFFEVGIVEEQVMGVGDVMSRE